MMRKRDPGSELRLSVGAEARAAVLVGNSDHGARALPDAALWALEQTLHAER